MVGRLNIIDVLNNVYKDKPQLKINDLCTNEGQEEGGRWMDHQFLREKNQCCSIFNFVF